MTLILISLWPSRFQNINASHVESTLLSQVRVAEVGQEIHAWVKEQSVYRIGQQTQNQQIFSLVEISDLFTIQ